MQLLKVKGIYIELLFSMDSTLLMENPAFYVKLFQDSVLGSDPRYEALLQVLRESNANPCPRLRALASRIFKFLSLIYHEQLPIIRAKILKAAYDFLLKFHAEARKTEQMKERNEARTGLRPSTQGTIRGKFIGSRPTTVDSLQASPSQRLYAQRIDFQTGRRTIHQGYEAPRLRLLNYCKLYEAPTALRPEPVEKKKVMTIFSSQKEEYLLPEDNSGQVIEDSQDSFLQVASPKRTPRRKLAASEQVRLDECHTVALALRRKQDQLKVLEQVEILQHKLAWAKNRSRIKSEQQRRLESPRLGSRRTQVASDTFACEGQVIDLRKDLAPDQEEDFELKLRKFNMRRVLSLHSGLLGAAEEKIRNCEQPSLTTEAWYTARRRPFSQICESQRRASRREQVEEIKNILTRNGGVLSARTLSRGMLAPQQQHRSLKGLPSQEYTLLRAREGKKDSKLKLKVKARAKKTNKR